MKCKLCSVRRVVKRRYLLRHVVSLSRNRELMLKCLEKSDLDQITKAFQKFTSSAFSGRRNIFWRSSTHASGIPVTKGQRQILWSCPATTRYIRSTPFFFMNMFNTRLSNDLSLNSSSFPFSFGPSRHGSGKYDIEVAERCNFKFRLPYVFEQVPSNTCDLTNWSGYIE